MLARRTLLTKLRHYTTLTSIQTALDTKNFKTAEQSFFQLSKADLAPKTAHSAVADAHRALLNHYKQQESPETLDSLLQIEKKLFQVGIVSYPSCLAALRMALNQRQPQKGIELWVSYLEALGTRTTKPITAIISAPNHIECSLLALTCYFEVCKQEGKTVNSGEAAIIVPLARVPTIIGDVKLPEGCRETLENGLRALREDRTDFATPSYLAALQKASFEETRVLYNEALARPTMPESVWAAFIRRLAENRQTKMALEAWVKMIESGIKPGNEAYNALLRACSLLHDRPLDQVESVWRKMVQQGVQPDAQAYGIKIAALHRNGRFDDAIALFNTARSEDRNNVDIFVVNNVLNALVNAKMFESAFSLLEWAQSNEIQPNDVTFNTLLRSAVDNNEEALSSKVLELMAKAEFAPGIVTYAHLLQSQFKQARKNGVDVSDRVEAILKEIKKHKVKENAQFLTILADGIAKTSRDIAATRRIFRTIRQTSDRIALPTFGAFIEAELRHGDVSKAVEYFELMGKHGVAPSIPTYTQMITGALNRKQPAVALEFWDRLVAARSWRVSPNTWTYMFILQHYSEEAMKDASYRELLEKALARLPEDRKQIDFAVAKRVLEVAEAGDELRAVCERVVMEEFDVRKAQMSAR